MKWKNKGHEFDEVYNNIKKIKKVYLFGAGHDGKMVYDILCKRYTSFEIDGFIDNKKEKIGTQKEGLPIYSLDQIKINNDVGIIVSFASEFTSVIDKQLTNYGLIKNVNFWHYEQFISILAAYEYNELFMPSICILPTTRCNLRCKACLNFTNYIKEFENRNIEKLKEEIDLFFSCVDYIGLFFISGGEPFLYSDLKELIIYINKKYRDKIYTFGMVTNGTIKPSAELLECIKENNVILTIDDYRDALSNKKKDITENMIYIQNGIGKSQALIRKYDQWINLYPCDNKEMSEEQLICKYDACHVPWQEYRNGRLFSCNYAAFAEKAGLVQGDSFSESLKMDALLEKKIIMEFRLGYSKNGYVEFCKKCAGYLDINNNVTVVAEQERL